MRPEVMLIAAVVNSRIHVFAFDPMYKAYKVLYCIIDPNCFKLIEKWGALLARLVSLTELYRPVNSVRIVLATAELNITIPALSKATQTLSCARRK
jgi:hypothetical protein